MPIFTAEEQARFRAFEAEQARGQRLLQVWSDVLEGRKSAEEGKAAVAAELQQGGAGAAPPPSSKTAPEGA